MRLKNVRTTIIDYQLFDTCWFVKALLWAGKKKSRNKYSGIHVLCMVLFTTNQFA